MKKNILKTGTSLVGIVCKGGIVMAGDRKVTAGGSVVVNKNFSKVIKLNEYLVMSWTGSLSDALMLTKLSRAELKLKHLKDKKRPTIKEAANLIAMIAYKSIRQPSMIPFIAGTMLGGVNEDGLTELFSIEPSGSATKIEEYVPMNMPIKSVRTKCLIGAAPIKNRAKSTRMAVREVLIDRAKV